jgi:hypothetical protein
MKSNPLTQIALYPFLSTMFIILNPLVNNMDQINPAMALRPLILTSLFAAALLLFFRVFVKHWQYASYLSFLSLFLIFNYGHLLNIIADKLPEENAGAYPMVLLAILLAILVILGLKRTFNRFGGTSRVTPYLNLVFAIAVIGQSLLGLVEFVKTSPVLSWQSGGHAVMTEADAELSLDCSISPDIYWIILDGYGRADVLKEIYGVDTSPLLASLEQKGFFIADQSHTNYINTVYSIPSAMYFSYLEPKPAKVSGYDYFPELVADNRIMALLEQCGYREFAFETGFTFTNYMQADHYLNYGTYLNELEELIIASTPLDLLLEELKLEPPPRSYEAHRGRVLYAFEKLAEIPQSPGPKFVYAHILTPHPPFVFDAQGNPVQPRRSYSIADGNDYRGSWEEYRKGYAAQVQYVNRLLEKTVSEIIHRSPSPPVIIIQGDHGPGGLLQWKSPERSCLWERSSILNAYYLPNGGSKDLYPEISPVNSFPIVLNAYFGTNLELKPDKTLFTSHRPGGDFIDITGQRESRENC